MQYSDTGVLPDYLLRQQQQMEAREEFHPLQSHQILQHRQVSTTSTSTSTTATITTSFSSSRTSMGTGFSVVSPATSVSLSSISNFSSGSSPTVNSHQSVHSSQSTGFSLASQNELSDQVLSAVLQRISSIFTSGCISSQQSSSNTFATP